MFKYSPSVSVVSLNLPDVDVPASTQRNVISHGFPRAERETFDEIFQGRSDGSSSDESTSR